MGYRSQYRRQSMRGVRLHVSSQELRRLLHVLGFRRRLYTADAALWVEKSVRLPERGVYVAEPLQELLSHVELFDKWVAPRSHQSDNNNRLSELFHIQRQWN